MVKKRHLVFFLSALLIISIPLVFADESEQEINLGLYEYPLSGAETVSYGSIILIFITAIILVSRKNLGKASKKILYFLIVLDVLAVTLYLTITTVHLNLTSETKGPVHWHADFEIWVCDEEINLVDPEGFSNKVGTPLLHEHNDNRIHVEGVIRDSREVNLAALFRAIGGSLADDEMKVPTNSGEVSVHNDESLCNGKPGRLYVLVNGQLYINHGLYVLAPYETVPPGDKIKIIFTEKPFSEINKNIKEN